ncbi:MAG: PPC domain-containing protein [Planctomycetaceae bacterium]|nr:PPC domain-containing protein [Planctomycetaceae bacterium]
MSGRCQSPHCLPSAVSLFWLALCLSAVLLPARRALADRPQAVYIFPAGGQQGQDVAVRVGGLNLHESPAFLIRGEGVTATSPLSRMETIWFEGPVIRQPASQKKETYPRDYRGSIQIDAAAKPGTRFWHLSTSQGITTGLKFVIGELPEIVELEIAGNPVPQEVTLPVTINGRIFPREDVDIWTVALAAGQTVSCEVMAERIGSPLDSRLEVRDPAGTVIAENVDAIGSDSQLTFTAKEAGLYSVRIHDITFSGLQHYVYRLTMTTGPVVEAIYPLGGQRGTSVPFELSGLGLQQERITLELAEQAEEFLDWQVPGHVGGRPVVLQTGDDPEHLEAEPNDPPAEGSPVPAAGQQAISAPAVLNGRIDQPGDVDSWLLQAEPGTRYELVVWAERLGTLLDSVIEVVAADGQVLAQADDSGGQIDSSLSFAPKGDGLCFLRIRDRLSSRGGVRFGYRVYFRPAAPPREVPHFAVHLPGDAVSVDRGSSEKIKLQMTRQNGFKGDITVKVTGLPEGVTAEPLVITVKDRNPVLELKATEEARIEVARAVVMVSSSLEDEVFEYPAQIKDADSEVATGELFVSAAVPTPFLYTGEFESKFAARGTMHSRHYSIERNGFTGPLVAKLAEDQARHLQGVTAADVAVPPEAETFDFTVQLPPWMEVGRTSRTCVMLVGQVTDPDGTRHTVSYTSTAQNDQVIVLTDPARLGLRLGQPAMRIQPGQQVRLPVVVARDRGLTGAVQVDLVLPAHLEGLASGSAVIPPGAAAVELDLKFADQPPEQINMPLVVRATTRDEKGNPVTALSELEVLLPTVSRAKAVSTGP